MFLKHKKRTHFLLSTLAVTICSSIVNGQEIDDLNLSKLSSLEQAKREAEDFENLVKLIKPSADSHIENIENIEDYAEFISNLEILCDNDCEEINNLKLLAE